MFSNFDEYSILCLEAAANSLWKDEPLDNLDKTIHELWNRLISDSSQNYWEPTHQNDAGTVEDKGDRARFTYAKKCPGDANNNARPANSTDDLLPEFFQYTSTIHPHLLGDTLESPREHIERRVTDNDKPKSVFHPEKLTSNTQPDAKLSDVRGMHSESSVLGSKHSQSFSDAQNGAKNEAFVADAEESQKYTRKCENDFRNIEILFHAGYSPDFDISEDNTPLPREQHIKHDSPPNLWSAKHTVGYERKQRQVFYDNPFDPRLTHDKPDMLSYLTHARRVAIRNVLLDVAERVSAIMEASTLRHRAHLLELSAERGHVLQRILEQQRRREEYYGVCTHTTIPIIMKDKHGDYCCVVESTMNETLRRLWAIDIPRSYLHSHPYVQPEIHKPFLVPWSLQGEHDTPSVFDTAGFQPVSPQESENKVESPSRWLQPEDLAFLLNLIDSQRKVSLSKQKRENAVNFKNPSPESTKAARNNNSSNLEVRNRTASASENVKRKLSYEENELNLNNSNNTESDHEKESEDLNILLKNHAITHTSPKISNEIDFGAVLEQIIEKPQNQIDNYSIPRKSRLELYTEGRKSCSLINQNSECNAQCTKATNSRSETQHQPGDAAIPASEGVNGCLTQITQQRAKEAARDIFLAQGDFYHPKQRNIPENIHKELITDESNKKGDQSSNQTTHCSKEHKDEPRHSTSKIAHTSRKKITDITEWRLLKVQQIVSKITRERKQKGPQSFEISDQARNVPDTIVNEQMDIAKKEALGERKIFSPSKRSRKEKIKKRVEALRGTSRPARNYTGTDAVNNKQINKSEQCSDEIYFPLNRRVERAIESSPKKQELGEKNAEYNSNKDCQFKQEGSVRSDPSPMKRQTKAIKITDPITMQDIDLGRIDTKPKTFANPPQYEELLPNPYADFYYDSQNNIDDSCTGPVTWSNTLNDLGQIVTLEQVMGVSGRNNKTDNTVEATKLQNRWNPDEKQELERDIFPEFIPRKNKIASANKSYFGTIHNEEQIPVHTPMNATSPQRDTYALFNEAQSPAAGPSIMDEVMTLMGHGPTPQLGQTNTIPAPDNTAQSPMLMRQHKHVGNQQPSQKDHRKQSVGQSSKLDAMGQFSEALANKLNQLGGITLTRQNRNDSQFGSSDFGQRSPNKQPPHVDKPSFFSVPQKQQQQKQQQQQLQQQQQPSSGHTSLNDPQKQSGFQQMNFNNQEQQLRQGEAARIQPPPGFIETAPTVARHQERSKDPQNQKNGSTKARETSNNGKNKEQLQASSSHSASNKGHMSGHRQGYSKKVGNIGTYVNTASTSNTTMCTPRQTYTSQAQPLPLPVRSNYMNYHVMPLMSQAPPRVQFCSFPPQPQGGQFLFQGQALQGSAARAMWPMTGQVTAPGYMLYPDQHVPAFLPTAQSPLQTHAYHQAHPPFYFQQPNRF